MVGITFPYEGSASISTTPYSCTTASTTPGVITTDCSMQAWFDVTNIAAGDAFEFSIWEKVNGTGGTQNRVYSTVLVGVQGSLSYAFPALLVGNGWDVQMVKIAGTDRTLGFSIRIVS